MVIAIRVKIYEVRGGTVLWNAAFIDATALWALVVDNPNIVGSFINRWVLSKQAVIYEWSFSSLRMNIVRVLMLKMQLTRLLSKTFFLGSIPTHTSFCERVAISFWSVHNSSVFFGFSN